MKKILLLGVLYIFVLNNSFGQVTFHSKRAGEWTSPSTWEENAVPTFEDNVIISSGIILDLNEAYTHNGNITINQTGSLTFNNTLVFNGTLDISGRYSHQSNTDTAFINYGTININSRGLLELNNFNAQKEDSVYSLINFGVLFNYEGGELRTGSSVLNENDITFDAASKVNISIIGTGSLELRGESTTTVNNTALIGDDLIILGTNPKICGTGIIQLGTNERNTIILLEGANFEAQRCPGSTVSVMDENGPKPVEIVSFVATDKLLKWDVIEERILGYEIQYSLDLEDWKKTGAIDSKGDGRHQYSYPVALKGYYRLKVLSVEEEKYSHIVYFTGSDEVNFYPNMTTAGSQITFTGHKLIRKIQIYDASGKLIKAYIPQSEHLIVDIFPGLYIVKIEGQNNVTKRRLIVQ